MAYRQRVREQQSAYLRREVVVDGKRLQRLRDLLVSKTGPTTSSTAGALTSRGDAKEVPVPSRQAHSSGMITTEDVTSDDADGTDGRSIDDLEMIYFTLLKLVARHQADWDKSALLNELEAEIATL